MPTETEIEKAQIMLKLKETIESMTEKELLMFIAIKLTVGTETNLGILRSCLSLARKIRGVE